MVAVTWDTASKPPEWLLTNDDKSAERDTTGAAWWTSVVATEYKDAGKCYVEYHLDVMQNASALMVGLATSAFTNSNKFVGETSTSWGLGASGTSQGTKWHNNSSAQANPPSFNTAGQVVQLAVDVDAGKWWVGVNNTWIGDPAAGTGALHTNVVGPVTVVLSGMDGALGSQATLRAKDADFSYTPPSGFSAWEGSEPAPTKSATLTLVDRSGGARASLTGLKWAFFDQVSPDLLAAPVDKGAIEETDAAGEIVIELPNTTLAAGGTGFLIISDTDGVAANASNAFAAPVVVQ